ncbi:hypothetical protein A3731_14920 [Roseovarius sp. HI0049]|nr:hypothetical protein A3731_14920 [Roseovarius sp. HI0049]
MALGAGLVADDRTRLWREVGILTARPAGPSPVALVVDMDETETDRLPDHRSVTLLGADIPLARKSALAHFPAAILTYLCGERDA